MKTIKLNATAVRNNFFQLLNQVAYENVRVIIEKAGSNKEVILQQKNPNEENYLHRVSELKKTYGALKDTPASNLSDDRLSGKRAAGYLKKIRKKW
jgi:hypothetical protein